MAAGRDSGLAPVADRRTRWGTAALLAVSGLSAIAATTGAIANVGNSQLPWLHWAAAAFAATAGAAVLWAGMERAGRERRRRRYIVLFAMGAAIWLFGQAIGYMVAANDPGLFDPRVETIPFLLGLPLAIVGAVGLARPAAMDRRDVLDATIDATMGAVALLIIWSVAVIPQWAPPRPDRIPLSRIDQGLLLAACVTTVILIAFSRKPGSLPLPQLMLFIGGCLLVVIADLVGQFGPDRLTEITVSVVGYWVGSTLLVAMFHRSAAEVEPPADARIRLAFAVGVPFGLVLIAGLLLLDTAQMALPNSALLKILPALWVITLLAVGISRATLSQSRRLARSASSAAQLSESAEFGWISALLRDSSEYVFVVDVHGSIVYCSPRCQQRLAHADTFAEVVESDHPEELRTLFTGVLAGAVPTGPYDMLMRGLEGEQREVEVHLRTVREVSFEGFVITGTDVTDTRRLVARLDLTHRYDELTGLLSRDAFIADVMRVENSAMPVGVAMLDLNDLGVWNETLGRGGGDAILQAVARHLDTLPGEIVAVGRVAGDGFGLLAVCTAPEQIIESVLDRVTTALRGLLLPDDTEVDVSFRAGYAVTTSEQQVIAQQLIDQADVALRRARSSRRSSVVRFRPGMNDALVRRLTTEQVIREALTDDRVEVHYQPIVNLRDDSVRTLEALVRLRAAKGQLLMPGEFISAAEYSGLLRDIDRRVREIVARDWPQLAGRIGADVRVSFNVHEMELNDALVTELLSADLAAKIVVEVTEDSLLSRPEQAVAALSALRAAGALVAIDDFGTGYSSLSQILSLPCDILKIDRSFIANMAIEPRTTSLVRATIQLAHDLGLSTVAEGVESAEEVAALRAMGCDRVQGFRYSRALPLPEVLQWLGGRT